MIQLPDDVQARGYRKIGSYDYAQVFYSESADFEGTEQEFVARGYGYEYLTVDPYTRFVVIK